MPVLGDCDGLPVIPEFTVWKQEPSKAIGMTKQGKNGKLWVQQRGSVSVNKIETSQGRVPMSASGFHMHRNTCAHTPYTCMRLHIYRLHSIPHT